MGTAHSWCWRPLWSGCAYLAATAAQWIGIYLPPFALLLWCAIAARHLRPAARAGCFGPENLFVVSLACRTRRCHAVRHLARRHASAGTSSNAAVLYCCMGALLSCASPRRADARQQRAVRRSAALSPSAEAIGKQVVVPNRTCPRGDRRTASALRRGVGHRLHEPAGRVIAEHNGQPTKRWWR